MDLLHELVFILSKNDSLQGFTHKLPNRSSSKSRVLFEAIISGKATNDATAAELVYGTSPKDKKYLMLKRSLINKLSQAINEMSYAEDEKENYIDIAFECRQKLAIAERLLKQNVFHNAEKIIKKTLDTAVQFQLNEVELDGRKHLRMIYSLEGNTKKLQETTTQIDRLYEEIGQQTKAEGFVQLLKARLLYSIARTQEIEEFANESISQIEEWQLNNKNIFLEQFRLILKIYSARMSDKPHTHISAVEHLQKILRYHPSLSTRTSEVFIGMELSRAYLASGQFNDAYSAIQNTLKLADYRSFEKFEVQTLHFEYCMKTANYAQAGEIIEEVKASPQFNFVYAQDQSAWLIREAYLYYAFINTNKQNLIPQYTKEFTNGIVTHDFINKAKAIQKDKQGYNISLLLISFLFAAEKDLNTIDYEGGSMKIYFHRHLKEMRDLRTQTFFKWCYQLANRNFQYTEKSSVYYIHEKLQALGGIASGSCEIIPYELLAEWIIDKYCTVSNNG